MDKKQLKNEFHKKFVEPLESQMRGLTLNNEPLVMGTEKEVSSWWLSKFDTLLAEKVEEVKKLRRYDAWKNGFNVDMTNGYNQAIDEVIKILNPNE